MVLHQMEGLCQQAVARALKRVMDSAGLVPYGYYFARMFEKKITRSQTQGSLENWLKLENYLYSFLIPFGNFDSTI